MRMPLGGLQVAKSPEVWGSKLCAFSFLRLLAAFQKILQYGRNNHRAYTPVAYVNFVGVFIQHVQLDIKSESKKTSVDIPQ